MNGAATTVRLATQGLLLFGALFAAIGSVVGVAPLLGAKNRPTDGLGIAGIGLGLAGLAVGLHARRPVARLVVLAGGPALAVALTGSVGRALAAGEPKAVKGLLVCAVFWAAVVQAWRALRDPELAREFAERRGRPLRALVGPALDALRGVALYACFVGLATSGAVAFSHLAPRSIHDSPVRLVAGLLGVLACALVGTVGLALGAASLCPRPKASQVPAAARDRIVALRAGGKTLREVATALAAEGHRAPGGRWTGPLLREVLGPRRRTLPLPLPSPPSGADGRAQGPAI